MINDKYDVPAFSKLVARSSEPPSLESVLTSPDIGGFNVTTLRNEPCARVTQEIKTFFASRDPDDLLLLYYSGVVLKDSEWGLHFTTTDTDPDEPTTAVPAYILQGAMRKSRSRLQVVLLDCRYVGSHQPGESPTLSTVRALRRVSRAKVGMYCPRAIPCPWPGKRELPHSP